MISYPTLQTPPIFLKEGEGGTMGMSRGKKGKRFGGTGGKDRIQIVDTKIKTFIKNLKIHCFAKQFEDIYCKYLHEQ